MTIKQYKNKAVKFLETNTSALDVDVLLCHFLHISKETLLLCQNEREMTFDETSLLDEALKRRQNGLAIAYITGHKEFYGNDFLVTMDTLIPKPDTETLVETAISKITRFVATRHTARFPIKILDLCCGTGCVGISVVKALEGGDSLNFSCDSANLSCALENLSCTFIDISKDALQVAQKNAQRLLGERVLSRLDFLQGDLFEAIPHETEVIPHEKGATCRKFDFILSNPPYIPHDEAVKLREDGRGDPLLALDGDGAGSTDGLFFVRKIIAQAKDFLIDGGGVFIECGESNIGTAADFAKSAGYKKIKIQDDLSGAKRVLALS